jgi:hypothetical protein
MHAFKGDVIFVAEYEDGALEQLLVPEKNLHLNDDFARPFAVLAQQREELPPGKIVSLKRLAR